MPRFKVGDTIYRVRATRACKHAWRPATVTDLHYWDKRLINLSVGHMGLSDWIKHYEPWPKPSEKGLRFKVMWDGIGYQDRSVRKTPLALARDLLKRFKVGRAGKLKLFPKSTDTIMTGTFGGREFSILGV